MNMPAAAIVIAQLILQYGIPGAIQIIQIISKPTITDADIAALKDIKPPSYYMTPPVGIAVITPPTP
jgi:hypothetical protein